MKELLLFSLVFAFLGCDQEQPYPKHGCITGIHKVRMLKEVIGCWHKDIHGAGVDQDAADQVADRLGVPRVDVSIKNEYFDINFSADEDCVCK